MRRLWIVVAVGVACACGDAFSPGHSRASLNLVPTFSENVYELLTGDLDQLHIRVTHIPGAAVILDTTVAVDTAGNVDLDLAVTLSAQTDSFAVLLEGIRSSDNTVLYSGFDTVVVTAGTITPPGDTIAVNYVGPCAAAAGCTVTVAPQDSTLTQGDSLLMRVTVDSSGQNIPGVPVSVTNLTPTLVTVSSTRRVRALPGPGGPARVVAKIHGAEDTLRLTVPPLGGAPALVIVTPGYAALRVAGPGKTVQLADTVKDNLGNILGTAVTWTSRSPGVATVSGGGLVTAAGRGIATIVGTAAAGVADSILVAVGDTTNHGDALVFAITNNRAFGQRKVGQTVQVDVLVDLRTGEALGSYTATFAWNQAVMHFDSSSAGTFSSAPVVNADTTGGTLTFAAASATDAASAPTLIHLFFKALAIGSDGHSLQLTELSGAPANNYVNYYLLGQYFVASGNAAIAP